MCKIKLLSLGLESQSQDFPKSVQIEPFLDVITSVLNLYSKSF